MNPTVTATILIADDDPTHLMLVEAALAGAGFVVHTASDGQEAVERFPEVRPDVVVLDVMMPRMTGIDACEHSIWGSISMTRPTVICEEGMKRWSVKSFRGKGIKSSFRRKFTRTMRRR